MNVSNLYLQKLKVDNYKSLKDSTIELQKGLNIIIGKNGAGKSNLLEFIYIYAAEDPFNLPRRKLNTNFSASIAYNSDSAAHLFSYNLEKSRKKDVVSSQDPYYAYDLTVAKWENNKETISSEKLEILPPYHQNQIENKKIIKELGVLRSLNKRYIKFELPEHGYWTEKPNRLVLNEFASFEKSFEGFSFFLNLESNIEFEIDLGDSLNKVIKENLISLKEYLLSQLNTFIERKSINAFLRTYSPISEIRFNPNLNIYSNEETTIVENLSIDFLIDGDWMPWSYLSDGTKRLFYLISECLSFDDGIILVEEPELGIHPHQLLKILDFLKEQSRTKQVIISTHSPLALDILNEDELDRIVIAKYEKGTRFHKLDEEEINKAKKYINEVGELSYYWLHSDLEK